MFLRIKFKPFRYNSQLIHYRSIEAFNLASKAQNDANNKMRENIIGAIINKHVPRTYYLSNNRWLSLKKEVGQYLDKLVAKDQDKTIKCSHKAGRGHNYDFLLDINGITYPIELKFNTQTIAGAPQYVSPMKPSQYLSNSYEEYYYDTYLSQIAEKAGLPCPPKTEYLKQIHGNAPECMLPFQKLYYKGCKGSSQCSQDPSDLAFYQFCNRLARESIKTFLATTELKIADLSAYLQETQQGKIYMLYYQGQLHLQHAPMDDYDIERVLKTTHNRYECLSKSGKKMKILLRWKNGNGIAFPAFQIS
jgi:hypothetical protein